MNVTLVTFPHNPAIRTSHLETSRLVEAHRRTGTYLSDPRLTLHAVPPTAFDATPGGPRPAQLAFDDLDTPLFDTTFVVVDLETTGTSPERDAITEIGAVKVRGGEVLGEFATLVNPGCAIPPQIIQVTGITTAMVLDAPRIEAVLPGFLEFAAGAVLVAHNARFDTGFLKAAGAPRPRPGGPAPPTPGAPGRRAFRGRSERWSRQHPCPRTATRPRRRASAG